MSTRTRLGADVGVGEGTGVSVGKAFVAAARLVGVAVSVGVAEGASGVVLGLAVAEGCAAMVEVGSGVGEVAVQPATIVSTVHEAKNNEIAMRKGLGWWKLDKDYSAPQGFLTLRLYGVWAGRSIQRPRADGYLGASGSRYSEAMRLAI